MKRWPSSVLAGLMGASALTAPAIAAPSGVMSVHGDQLVAATTTLRRLDIAPGATLHAPAGHDLTLSVDGVGVPVAAGSYAGHVVLTVTQDIPVTFQQLPPHHFRAAIYVDDGAYRPDKSVRAVVTGGTVSNREARDVKITSHDENFNGILVTGQSTYRIANPTIRFVGNGGDDFAGFGAAIMSSGKADVTVDHADILDKGAVRTAVFVGGHSTMHVNDSSIEVKNGVLPSDYKFTIEVGKMKEVPWMLGLSGNVRATNLVDDGTAYYTRTHIKAQGWGALSTDVSHHVRLHATDSLIETVQSGYGAYSIGDSLDLFRHCTFNVADMALIMAAEGSGTFTDGTVVNSRRLGVMMHSGTGGGVLTIDKGSVFNTASTAIQIKGRGATVVVDHAEIHPGDGIILQAMLNDDPFAGGAGPIVGVQGPHPRSGGPGGPPGPLGPPHPDVDATFRGVSLKGDIINSRTSQGGLDVKLEGARLAGAISIATQAPVSGAAPTQATYKEIGNVRNTFGPTHDAHGLTVSLDGGSSWTVDKTSYLTGLSLAPGASIKGADGRAVTLTVDGTPMPLRAGAYHGAIVLAVAGG